MSMLNRLPENHPLGRVYRILSALTGLGLVIFGILGFAGALGYFDTEGDRVAGLSTNGVLSTISVVVGLILIGATFAGGNVSSIMDLVVGALFMISGLANMCVLRTSYNYLNFSMSNVIFSLVVGSAIFMFGLYGRTGGRRRPAPVAQQNAAGRAAPTT